VHIRDRNLSGRQIRRDSFRADSRPSTARIEMSNLDDRRIAPQSPLC
jgi:hypothetical protein